MVDEEILDLFNEFDLAALNYVFLPLINDKLHAWRQAWSKQRVRTYNKDPPLFVSGYLVR